MNIPITDQFAHVVVTIPFLLEMRSGITSRRPTTAIPKHNTNNSNNNVSEQLLGTSQIVPTQIEFQASQSAFQPISKPPNTSNASTIIIRKPSSTTSTTTTTNTTSDTTETVNKSTSSVQSKINNFQKVNVNSSRPFPIVRSNSIATSKVELPKTGEDQNKPSFKRERSEMIKIPSLKKRTSPIPMASSTSNVLAAPVAKVATEGKLTLEELHNPTTTNVSKVPTSLPPSTYGNPPNAPIASTKGIVTTSSPKQSRGTNNEGNGGYLTPSSDEEYSPSGKYRIPAYNDTPIEAVNGENPDISNYHD